MSDLPELLEAVAERMVETINALIDESGGEHFGIGDLRPLAAELIDYTLNREFGDIDAAPSRALGSQASTGEAVASNLPTECKYCGATKYERLSICDGVCDDCEKRGPPTVPSSGWCDDPDCCLCRKEAEMWPKQGQCLKCPYKLNGIFAETGCPNCPNREAA